VPVDVDDFHARLNRGVTGRVIQQHHEAMAFNKNAEWKCWRALERRVHLGVPLHAGVAAAQAGERLGNHLAKPQPRHRMVELRPLGGKHAIHLSLGRIAI
jgi:hypothetical protein